MAAAAAANQTALLEVNDMTPDVLRTTNVAVSDARSRSYAYVYYFAVAAGGLAIIASVCMRDFDQYLTGHVSRQLYHKKEAHADSLEALEERTQTSEVNGKEPEAAV